MEITSICLYFHINKMTYYFSKRERTFMWEGTYRGKEQAGNQSIGLSFYDCSSSGYLEMIVDQYILGTVQGKYREYLEKVNLTQEARDRTHQLLNELSLLQLIFNSSSTDQQTLITEKLREVEKVIDARLKGQGWISYFSRSSEVVALDETWRAIQKSEEGAKQQLIQDICCLK